MGSNRARGGQTGCGRYGRGSRHTNPHGPAVPDEPGLAHLLAVREMLDTRQESTGPGPKTWRAATLPGRAPHRFTVLDLQTIGYADAVTLPISAVPERPGAPMRLTATVDYLTCADICVPYVAELALSLASGPAEASPFSHDIARALARVPDEKSGALSVVGVSLEGSPDVPRLSVRIASDEPLAAPDVFVEAPAPLAFSAPEAEFSRDRRSATLTLTVYNGESLEGHLIVCRSRRPWSMAIAPWSSGRTSASRRCGPGCQPGQDGETTTLLALGLALLGGLVLNLMPCVLPVLSMKLLAVVGHGGGQRRRCAPASSPPPPASSLHS